MEHYTELVIIFSVWLLPINDQVYRHSNVHKKGSHAAMPAAVMTPDTRRMMTERLEPEYQVYNYVKERLRKQYEQCVK